jgi:hypothetical protein
VAGALELSRARASAACGPCFVWRHCECTQTSERSSFDITEA